MARPVTISDEAILGAAREVFFERGPGATTADIAARAGVSEGSIFKRWKTKEQLFLACMDAGRIEETPWITKLPGRVGTRTMREHLEEIGLELVALFRVLMPLIMMRHSLGDQARRDVSAEDAGPNVARTKLAAYFDAERKRGRIGNVDVDVLARVYLGAIFNYCHLELLMAGNDPAPVAAESFIRSYVEILVSGITPKSPEKKR